MKNRESAGGPEPLSPSATWREPRGASLVWLGHSLAKAIRRVQIPRTALSIEDGLGPRVGAASARSKANSRGRRLGAAIVAQCLFLDAGNEKTTDDFIAETAASAAEGMGILRRQHRVRKPS